MRTRLPRLLPALLLLLAAQLPSARARADEAASGPALRVAIVVGTNEGESDEAPLRWAEHDATRVADVLGRLGGVPPERLMLLRGARRQDVLRALAAAKVRVAEARAAGQRALLLFYYAGHAGAGALHLGGSQLSFDELRRVAADVGADVRVLVLDACRSGEMTRVRGARPAKPFELSATDRLDASGEAILTSSAAGEDAQESDRLRGGLFTHHLIAGLRGAADQSADGKITLGEAWRYAYARTLHSSSRTAALQHPTYAFQVRGRAEPTLTELAPAQGSAVLTLQDAGYWVLFHGGASGKPTAEGDATEAFAQAGTKMVLPAGRWLLRRRDEKGVAEGELELRAGSEASVSVKELRWLPYGQTVRRGLSPRAALGVSVGAGVTGPPLPQLSAAWTTAVGGRIELSGVALELSLGWSRADSSGAGSSLAHLTLTHDTVGGALAATHLFDLGRSWAVGLGLRAGVDGVWQRFETTGEATDRASVAARIAPTARLEWAPAPRHVVGLQCAVDVWWMRRQQDEGSQWKSEVVPGCGLAWTVYR